MKVWAVTRAKTPRLAKPLGQGCLEGDEMMHAADSCPSAHGQPCCAESWGHRGGDGARSVCISCFASRPSSHDHGATRPARTQPWGSPVNPHFVAWPSLQPLREPPGEATWRFCRRCHGHLGRRKQSRPINAPLQGPGTKPPSRCPASRRSGGVSPAPRWWLSPPAASPPALRSLLSPTDSEITPSRHPPSPGPRHGLRSWGLLSLRQLPLAHCMATERHRGSS